MPENDEEPSSSVLLPRRKVIYCGACGMPPEYCEYGPNFETHCDPWLKKHHPDLRKELMAQRSSGSRSMLTDENVENNKSTSVVVKPDKPWTTEERLTKFYEKYVPEKMDTVPSLMEKYAGKEDKLFEALVKKYGPEPLDPYYSDSDDEGEDHDEEDNDEDAAKATTTTTTSSSSVKKRRGAKAKEAVDTGKIKVLVQKQDKKKKRVLTVVTGLEPALAVYSEHKLKDASKAFSKRFAGSSSVKDDTIIVQGDHVLELAEMIVDKFQVCHALSRVVMKYVCLCESF
jgi:density-regulated protein DRP1